MKKTLLAVALLIGLAGAAKAGSVPAGYIPPDLYFMGVSSVAVTNNTGIANQTRVCFPDGQCRAVTEDVSSANKYRALLMTSTATWLSGTEDSGLMYGMPEQSTAAYAVYAVKSKVSASKFILAGSTWAHVQSNYAVLNSTFGVNGWVYLGSVWNGDNSGAPGDIVNFTQVGRTTIFRNNCVQSASGYGGSPGVRLATTAGANTLTWAYAAGMGAAQVPANILQGYVTATGGAREAAVYGIMNGAAVTGLFTWQGAAIPTKATVFMSLADGVYVADISAVSSNPHDIILSGYSDGALK